MEGRTSSRQRRSVNKAIDYSYKKGGKMEIDTYTSDWHSTGSTDDSKHKKKSSTKEKKKENKDPEQPAPQRKRKSTGAENGAIRKKTKLSDAAIAKLDKKEKTSETKTPNKKNTIKKTQSKKTSIAPSLSSLSAATQVKNVPTVSASTKTKSPVKPSSLSSPVKKSSLSRQSVSKSTKQSSSSLSKPVSKKTKEIKEKIVPVPESDSDTVEDDVPEPVPEVKASRRSSGIKKTQQKPVVVKAKEKKRASMDEQTIVDAAEYLTSLQEQDEMYKTLLEQKDKSYSSLLSTYTKLKKSHEVQQGRLRTLVSDFENNAKVHEADSERVIEYWKAENQRLEEALTEKGVKKQQAEYAELRQEYDELLTNKNELDEKLTATIAELRSFKKQFREQQNDFNSTNNFHMKKIRDQERIIDYYSIMSGIQIVPGASSTDPVRCTLHNTEDNRRLDFTIDVDADSTESEEVVIEYNPIKLEFGKMPIPTFLEEEIAFSPQAAPLFLKHVLGHVFNKTEEEEE